MKYTEFPLLQHMQILYLFCLWLICSIYPEIFPFKQEQQSFTSFKMNKLKQLVRMTRKHHNHTLQTSVEETQNTNSHLTSGRQFKLNKQLSHPQQDDSICITRWDTNYCLTKQGSKITNNWGYNQNASTTTQTQHYADSNKRY